MRLQKAIARAGICSRRQAERFIAAGQVKVNGQTVTEPGVKVDVHRDVIHVGDRRVESEPRTYVLLNKPGGVVTTVRDPRGRRTVVDYVPRDVRLYPVGRLDYETEGLLVMTNDGELTYRLTHPSFEVPKTYEAVLRGRVCSRAINRLEKGVRLQDGMTWPAKVNVIGRNEKTTRLHITIHEGRNRQVRRMADAVGHPVVYLRRIRFGDLTLGNVALGAWRFLHEHEVDVLYRGVGLTRK